MGATGERKGDDEGDNGSVPRAYLVERLQRQGQEDATAAEHLDLSIADSASPERAALHTLCRRAGNTYLTWSLALPSKRDEPILLKPSEGDTRPVTPASIGVTADMPPAALKVQLAFTSLELPHLCCA